MRYPLLQRRDIEGDVVKFALRPHAGVAATALVLGIVLWGCDPAEETDAGPDADGSSDMDASADAEIPTDASIDAPPTDAGEPDAGSAAHACALTQGR